MRCWTKVSLKKKLKETKNTNNDNYAPLIVIRAKQNQYTVYFRIIGHNYLTTVSFIFTCL